ncbi:hypothetical protein [Seohaeicola saemankumensis]|uniref:hypothetical protein n=1 Tax=Seohaeicola saemankumensis TaxID=481181 RepID=UPI001E5E7132|nr:hypothetical protein [Seohaeicola saemankumensis]
MKQDEITRPELTMPKAEGVLLRDIYAAADTILEYGSGGSTVMAAEMGKRVTSVESDKAWAQMMRAWFAANPPAGQVDIVWSDIGPTKEWGHPVDDSAWKRFARYPLEVWDLPDFAHPDVILVDGRFRAGCALASVFRITQPVTLCFDDYTNRPRHHEVEEFLGAPAKIVGRMAYFALRPMPVPAERLLRVIQLMTRP